jgi:trehalose 6-phosphate phosphatase
MIVPPPTPKSPLNAPAAVAITARRASRDDIAGILRMVSAPTAEALAESLRPLTEDPPRAAIFCDIDGTLAPIVRRAEEAHVREQVSLILGRLARRYGCVACVSGRPAAEARRLVGVGGITYAGSHGAELLEPGSSRPRLIPAFKSWEGRVRRFASARDTRELRLLRVRIEDKGPITAFHWRGVPHEEAARTHLEGIAQEAEADGLATHWGRKVLEIRPPVPIDKGQAVRELVAGTRSRSALFGGDDATDLDAFDALDALVADGDLEAAVRVGVRSEEGPPAIVERADLVVDGVPGFAKVLSALAEV